ncbi:MAG: hypothetical protein KBA06_03005 [Saprospiraceae bacterium]|nr:hypothetical protein [Saprospiraceae bacterium]
MSVLYDIAIQFYYLSIKLAAIFGNKKAIDWINGRKIEQITPFESKLPVIWMHCSSLGEFEQGKPLLTYLFEHYKDQYFILLSFYSPSGFNKQKQCKFADLVIYLPLDTQKKAIDFIYKYKPSLSIFVKYDFWYHFFRQINAHHIPLILISSHFRPDQLFFSNKISFFKRLLNNVTYFFVQDKDSKELLNTIGISNNVLVVGDTRLDAVISTSQEKFDDKIITEFLENQQCVIFGSIWEEDLVVITDWILKCKQKIILAPHDISFSKKLSEVFEDSSQYSNFQAHRNILIIDNIGMLSKLYRYAKFAYIGGGFGKGIHNTLEPLAYKLPIIFGKKYSKFPEAIEQIKLETSFSINDAVEFSTIADRLLATSPNHDMQSRIENYLRTNKGATQKIILILEKYL